MLAHTIRTNNDEPLRQCTLEHSSHEPVDYNLKRVGRPRQKWKWSTYARLAKINLGVTPADFKGLPEHYVASMIPKIRNRTILYQ